MTVLIRRVRGILFVDYVRMLRAESGLNLDLYLRTEDWPFLTRRIDTDGWYPMETFERFGIAIIQGIAGGQLEAVRAWGRLQVERVLEEFPTLVASGDPRETLMRFQTVRRAFFDFDAMDVLEVLDEEAIIAVHYRMSLEAEEPACHQTLGFLERLVEIAGGEDVTGSLEACSWQGAARTLLRISWRTG